MYIQNNGGYMNDLEKEKIVNAVEKLYNKALTDIDKLTKIPNSGGKIRARNGKLGEKISEIAWKMVGDYYIKTQNIAFDTIKGSKKKITCKNKGGILKVQVDRHQFINEKLVHVEECKSYLDRCYFERAQVDFDRIKKHHKNVSTSILSLEDSIAKESYDFLMAEGDVDKVSYLLDGKRSSELPYWKPGSIKNMNLQKTESYVNYIISIFEREVK